SRGKSPNFSRT
ncbi:bacterial extracellular solute-binding family protein, partial [Vibrio parahaemolyticus V-223/04]